MRLMRNAPAPLALDFAPPRRRPSWLGWLVLVLGVLAATAVVLETGAARRDLDERQAIVERLRAQVRSARPAAPSARTAGHDASAALAVAAQLNADWGGVFAELAAAHDRDVSLLELQADVGRGGLRLVGEAPTLEAAFAYVERLQARDGLRGAALDSHQWDDSGRNSVLRFTISAAWGGAR